jgi:hypothetical protein
VLDAERGADSNQFVVIDPHGEPKSLLPIK